MSKLSLLINLVFFLSLALVCVVPVVFSPLSLTVAPFMIVGINWFITKLLFIPTETRVYAWYELHEAKTVSLVQESGAAGERLFGSAA